MTNNSGKGEQRCELDVTMTWSSMVFTIHLYLILIILYSGITVLELVVEGPGNICVIR